MASKHTVRFNSKTNSYTFVDNSDKTQTKKGFIFDRYLFRVSLNNNSIAVYKNKQTQEIALTREYYNSNTGEKPIFKSYEEFDKIIDKLDGVNNISNLGIMLNRYFDFCDVFNDNNN